MRARGFSLIELVVALVITGIVASATTTALSQMLRSKSRSTARLQAHSRAEMAAAHMARDVMATARREDLYLTRVRVVDGQGTDDLLVIMRSARAVRGLELVPEGGEFEAQYRVAPASPADQTPTLWRRLDPALDEVLDGGGVASPLVRGVRSISVEASNGEEWLAAWDSDRDGLPHGVRIVVTAMSEDGSASAVSRRVVALDRVPTPPQDETGGGG